MQSSTCLGLAFLSTRSSCPAPALIAGGGVASSNRVLLVGRRRSCSWSQLLPCSAGATAATSHPTLLHKQDGDGESNGRNLLQFEPSIWGDFFLTYTSPLDCSTQQRRMLERANQLKKHVSEAIAASSTCGLYERMHLIHVLGRLCLDHLFEEEISAMLTQINDADVSGCDLKTVAFRFYLLREHGYHVSSDVLTKFCDIHGTFAANNPSDLLNLYNAASLRTTGETILDEAISFTKSSLKSIITRMEGPLAREIKRSLDIPLPRRVKIYEAKHYISSYVQETKGDNDNILELAKLNANIMQIQYQEELRTITRWWSDLELNSKLYFARDRVVECYFWVVGVYYEPSYSRGRIILTKLLAIVSLG